MMPSFLAPSNVNEIQVALVEFKKYMFEMIEDEKRLLSESVEQRSNLPSAMVRLSEQENNAEVKGKKGLSIDEMFGNLFFYNLAGHETTAGALSYAITLLASDLKWQTWVREELDEVVGKDSKVEDWDYETNFPRLKRCLAVMVCSSYNPIKRCKELTNLASARDTTSVWPCPLNFEVHRKCSNHYHQRQKPHSASQDVDSYQSRRHSHKSRLLGS